MVFQPQHYWHLGWDNSALGSFLCIIGASLVAQMVKNLPEMQETLVWSLSQEDPLEKGVVTHSSILAWRIPWTEEPGGLQSMGLQRVRHDWVANTYTFTVYFRMFSSIPGLYLLDANSNPSLVIITTNVPRQCQMSPEGQNHPLVANCWVKWKRKRTLEFRVMKKDLLT